METQDATKVPQISPSSGTGSPARGRVAQAIDANAAEKIDVATGARTGAPDAPSVHDVFLASLPRR